MSTTSSSTSNQFRSHTITLHRKATSNDRILVEVHLKRLLNANSLTGSEQILSFLKALLFYALAIANENPAFEHSVFISPNEQWRVTDLVTLSRVLSAPSETSTQVVGKCGNIIIAWLYSNKKTVRLFSTEAKQICEERIRAVTLNIQSEPPAVVVAPVAPVAPVALVAHVAPVAQSHYFTDENGAHHGPFPNAEVATWESQYYNEGRCRLYNCYTLSSTCVTCMLNNLDDPDDLEDDLADLADLLFCPDTSASVDSSP